MIQRKLRLDDLHVETFEVSRDERQRGTVVGNEATIGCTHWCSEDGNTCDWDCGASFEQQRECAGTFSCPGGCGTGGVTAYPC